MNAQHFQEENALQYLRQRFSLPWHFKRADIAIYFEYPRSLSTRKIFQRLGLEYNSTITHGFSEAIPVFIKEVGGNFVERAPSINHFCERVLLTFGNDKNIVADFIENQYVIKYNNILVTASFNGHFPGFHQGFEVNPYNLLKIRQEMRKEGLYNGCVLSFKEICEWYFENPGEKGVMRRLCNILDIPYVNNTPNGVKPSQPCSFRNLETNEVLHFTSFSHAGRELGLDKSSIERNFRGRKRFHSGNTPFQAVYPN